MRKNYKFYLIKIIVTVIILVAGVVIFRNKIIENLGSVGGAVAGFLLGSVATDFVAGFILYREDKRKISDKGFAYDKNRYVKQLSVGGKKTEIWYDAIEFKGEPVYKVEDDPEKFFELDPVIQANYASIMQAHRASFIRNSNMVRLDDYKRGEDGTVYLYTSRTTFYNDLVTNRSMDYKFNGGLTVRQIYECANFLSPLNKSKMSNHIGYGAFVFYGNCMIIANRGGNATLSKNKFTSALAVGLAENDVIKSHDPLEDNKHFTEYTPVLGTDDLFSGILLVRLSDILNIDLKKIRGYFKEGKIKIHTLGFGQLVYTGGKPQFYFAIVIDESVDLSSVNDKTKLKEKKKRIDFNTKMVFAEGITLAKEGGYKLILKQRGTRRTVKADAEKSFFINYWHLTSRPPIEGVPDWIYAD